MSIPPLPPAADRGGFNPYQAPASGATATGIRGGREELVTVAKYQKGVLACILAQIMAVLLQFLVPPEAALMIMLMSIVASLAGTVFVFLLATKIYGTGAGIGLGLLTFLPLIGLLVLLVVNGKATRTLRGNGIRVGLMGAKVADI